MHCGQRGPRDLLVAGRSERPSRAHAGEQTSLSGAAVSFAQGSSRPPAREKEQAASTLAFGTDRRVFTSWRPEMAELLGRLSNHARDLFHFVLDHFDFILSSTAFIPFCPQLFYFFLFF